MLDSGARVRCEPAFGSEERLWICYVPTFTCRQGDAARICDGGARRRLGVVPSDVRGEADPGPSHQGGRSATDTVCDVNRDRDRLGGFGGRSFGRRRRLARAACFSMAFQSRGGRAGAISRASDRTASTMCGRSGKVSDSSTVVQKAVCSSFGAGFSIAAPDGRATARLASRRARVGIKKARSHGEPGARRLSRSGATARVVQHEDIFSCRQLSIRAERRASVRGARRFRRAEAASRWMSSAGMNELRAAGAARLCISNT